ncbi:unnamed protein product [Phytophthora lilii]|uniref:Unnamed protein product n=1 Tax=Phytophthora lilii TaxID=2077276 RepID=A0A9W6TDV2_9STRA|nr:unnamed protein product [Phytophthora lilii]
MDTADGMPLAPHLRVSSRRAPPDEMLLAAAVVAVAALSAAADAAACDTTSLADLLTSTNATTCQSESGYSLTSLVSPTTAEMKLMCTSSACQVWLAQLKEMAPSECTIGTFALYAGLITPVDNYCAGGSASSSTSSSMSGSSSSASAGSSTSRSPATLAPSSSSSSKTESSTGLSTSSPKTTSPAVTPTSGSTSTSGFSSGTSSSSTTAPTGFESPVGVGLVRLLEDDHASAEYGDNTQATSKTYSSGASVPKGSLSKINLWEDPVIVAARISIDRVTLGTLIGRGGFGEVYRGRYRHQDVAIKMLLQEKRKDLVQIQAFLTEIRLMATMEHPFIVQFIGIAWESLSDLYCVTEFMEGGDLRSLLNDYKANESPQGMDATKVEIAYQVAYALTYLHSLDPVVLHRDLKSRNILLTETLDAKITDFGTSRARSNETMTAGVGSWMWMAPEVMLGGHYDEKADVFSLGIVLSELDTHERYS